MVKMVEVIQKFLKHVHDAEQNVRQYGSLGHIPPDAVGDSWDDNFAESYNQLRGYLRPVANRLFQVPARLTYINRPIIAETAVQAWMFFLNPCDALYGDGDVFNTPEYIAIKKLAMGELLKINRKLLTRKSKKLPCLKKKIVRTELLQLFTILTEHHASDKQDNEKILRILDLAKKTGWSQSKVTRRMQKLFKARNPMKRYKGLFFDDSLKNRKNVIDSILSIDEIVDDHKYE